MAINLKKAVQLAVKALEYQIRIVAFDANMHDVMGIKSDKAIKASEAKKIYSEAIQLLQGLIPDGKK